MATDCEISLSQRVGFRPRAAGVLAALKSLAGYQSMALEDVSQVSHPSPAAGSWYRQLLYRSSRSYWSPSANSLRSRFLSCIYYSFPNIVDYTYKSLKCQGKYYSLLVFCWILQSYWQHKGLLVSGNNF